MLHLTDIRLVEATSHDIARSLNYSMKFSPITKQVLQQQFKTTRKLTYRDIEKMYPPDTFSKGNGTINKNFAKEIGKDIIEVHKRTNDVEQVNMMDFAKGFVKIIENTVKNKK